MARLCAISIFWLVVLLSSFRDTTSMDCLDDSQLSFIDKIAVDLKPCPDKYCPCMQDDQLRCCLRPEFIAIGGAVLVAIVVAVVVGSVIVCCLLCLCCPCCMLYKRRQSGTVYRSVPQTIVVAPQPLQQQMPVYAPLPTPVPMPMQGYSQTTASQVPPPQAGQQPPPYSEVSANAGYAKQAPYNPSFQ